MQSNMINLKNWFSIFCAAVILMLLAGCMPLQPNAEMVVPAVTADSESESNTNAANLGDAMEMGAAVATITSPSLVLRQSPDEESDVLQELAEGDVYKVIGISTDGTWVRLEALNAPNGSGWVAARSVTVRGDITDVPITDESGEAISRPTPAPGGVVVLTDGTRLRVRAEANTDAEIVGYVYDGEAYNVLETTSDGSWARLDVAGIPDGGWVSTEFLTFPGDAVPEEGSVAEEAPTPEATPAPEEQPAAEEAATEEPVAEEPAAEEAATAEPTAEEATAEEAPAAEATAAPAEEAATEAATAEPAEEAEATPAPAEEAATETATPAPEEADSAATPVAEEETDSGDAELPVPNPGEAIVYTDGTRLRVRSAPSEESEIVGYVQNGDVYAVLETSEDGLWVRLDIPEIEGGGWVADIFVLTAQ